MSALILLLMEKTGLGKFLSSLIVYAIILGAVVLGFWGWSAARYHAGYTAGSAHERIAWEKEKAATLAAQAAQKAADQAKIDQITADYRALQEREQQARAEAALEAAIRKEQADQKPAIPRSISRALNGVR